MSDSDIQRSIDLYNTTLRDAAASRVVAPADIFRTDLITADEQSYLDDIMKNGGVRQLIEVTDEACKQRNEELTKLCTKQIANLIKGRTPEEIRRTFGITPGM
jgi:hypothetical protein